MLLGMTNLDIDSPAEILNDQPQHHIIEETEARILGLAVGIADHNASTEDEAVVIVPRTNVADAFEEHLRGLPYTKREREIGNVADHMFGRNGVSRDVAMESVLRNYDERVTSQLDEAVSLDVPLSVE
ncbi:MAG: hypothetical protein JWN26_846 [Candidatus Saccharibacteria bacterium]|nr:hypothetical protein [Candidatus Saccharibacteria bacterium]